MKAKRSETQAGGKARRADGTAVVLERNRFSMAYAWLQDQDLKGSLFALLREYGVEPRLAMHDISLRFAGAEAELSAPVPDYQLLSVFAKALDDVSALTLKAFNARNPMYATGTDLDLLLPLYNMTREAGESDASVRARIWRYLREKHPDSCIPI